MNIREEQAFSMSFSITNDGKEERHGRETEMIITVTLNPAVDKTITLSRMVQGQVNRATAVRNVAGGKGINVGKVLLQYRYPVTMLGFLGGHTGSFIEAEVKKLGASCHFTHIEGETRTSINVLEESGYVTEILEPGPVITQEALLSLQESLTRTVSEGDWVVFSGSAPAGVPVQIYDMLITMVKKLGARPVLDTSGSLLKEGAGALPYMVKPNVRELEGLLGKRLADREAVRDAARLLARRGIPHVLVSMGEKGMVYVSGEQAWYAAAPKVAVQNTVGSGDSAVAAFVMAMEQKLSAEDALRLCVAVSAANTTTLENGVIPKTYAEQLLKQIQVFPI